MKKRILILGAGAYQMPLIKQAKVMMLEVLVVSPKGNYPGINLADIFIEMDTTDVNGVLGVAKKYKIDAVVTTGTDVCMPTLGKIVDEMNLVGVSYESALKSMDKILMKNAFMANNVPTAAFDSFDNYDDALIFANRLGFPLMVKASDSSGSRGIIKVSSESSFDNAWKAATTVSRNGNIIVEEFLEGKEFGVQAFISKGKVIQIIPHGDIIKTGEITTPIGHYLPLDFDETLIKKVNKVVENAVKALRIDNCISNVDLILVNNEPKVIEIGARMGATCLPENISVFYGDNVYSYLINLALGLDPVFLEKNFQPNASLLIISNKSGIIKTIHVPNSLKKHPNLIELRIDVKPGDTINNFQVGPDRLGHLVVKEETTQSAIELVKKMIEQIKIDLV